jgi:glycolate oxidase FAD binding subunit
VAELLTELVESCPATAPRRARPEDAVDGVPAEVVAFPPTTAQVAAVLRVAAAQGCSVVARGAGTKLDWACPPRSAQLVVDLSRLKAVLEHASGDLLVRVEAGVPLADLDAELARAGQFLPIDEVVPGSTIGGVVATGLSGPVRYRHGAVRDLVTGVTVVRPDGVVARSGSKVVKNVAGYDLPKLFTGSFGTLGIVTEVTFKLRPRPAARRFVTATFASEEELRPALAQVLDSQADPSAIELDRPDPAGATTLCVQLDGQPQPLSARVEALAGLLGSSAGGSQPPSWWGRLPGAVTMKATAPLASLPALLGTLRRLAAELELSPASRGSAGVGVLYVGLPALSPGPAVARLLGGLRRFCEPLTGAVTVLRAPRHIKATLDPWGEVPGLELMRRVKEQFDPGQRMAPGRFVGGM